MTSRQQRAPIKAEEGLQRVDASISVLRRLDIADKHDWSVQHKLCGRPWSKIVGRKSAMCRRFSIMDIDDPVV